MLTVTEKNFGMLRERIVNMNGILCEQVEKSLHNQSDSK